MSDDEAPPPITDGPLGMIVDRASDVEPEEICWLWRDRIALGKVTMIAGDPGLGKSMFALHLAAIVSRGGTLPVDRTVAPMGSALIVSAEDTAADTIVPRLIAAGADLTKVSILRCVRCPSDDGLTVIERELSLDRDIDAVERCVAKMDTCQLVIIDPISAYLGRVDSHRNSEVRAVLAPVCKLAERLGVAVVAITHLSKAVAVGAQYRVVGSIAFSAAVRSTMFVAKDHNDPLRRLVIPGKTNLGVDGIGAIAYRVKQNIAGRPYLEFEPDPIAISADDALQPESDEERAFLRDEAVDWLRGHLVGEMKANEVKKAAQLDGISERTLKRAKKRLGVYSGRRHVPGVWYWSMAPIVGDIQGGQPPDDFTDSEKAGPLGTVVPVGESRGLQPDDNCKGAKGANSLRVDDPDGNGRPPITI